MAKDKPRREAKKPKKKKAKPAAGGTQSPLPVPGQAAPSAK